MTPTPDTLPPHSPAAEQGVLGCCLLDPKSGVDEALVHLVSRREAHLAFYDLRHQIIFKVLLEMQEARRAIDVITLAETLKDRGELAQVGGAEYLGQLQDQVPSAAMLPEYAGIVAAKWKLRKMIGALAKAQLTLDGSREEKGKSVTAEALIEQIGADVLDALDDSATTARQAQRLGSYFPKIIERMDRFCQGKKVMLGLSTGFNYLDNYTCGLKGGEYLVIAARPGQGKTSIVMQIAEHVAVTLGEPVAMFSMEMSGESLAERTLFSFSGVNYQHYRNGFLSNDDIRKLTIGMEKLNKAPIYIDDESCMNIQRLAVEARKLKRQKGIKLVCIDYLQLMPATPGRENDMRARELADISMGLKRLAKELDLPVVVLAQMNRSIESDEAKGRKPVLSDLRDCGQIEADADVVGFLYPPKLKREEDQWAETGDMPPAFAWLKRHPLPDELRKEMEHQKLFPEWTLANHKKYLRRVNLLIAKQRNGPTGDIALVYQAPLMRFEDAYTPGTEPGEKGEA